MGSWKASRSSAAAAPSRALWRSRSTVVLGFLVIAAVVVVLGGCGSSSGGSSSSTSSSEGSGGSEAGATTASSTTPASKASSASSEVSANAEEIEKHCPEEPIKVAFAKGAGDTWTKITLATLEEAASNCPAIEEVLFTDAGGDQTKGISDINGLVAQGTNILIVMPEFGPAEIPAMRAAVSAGTTVVPQIDDVGGQIGTDYSAEVLVDTEAVGEAWAEWLHKTVGSGKVVFLGGIPGAQSSAQLFEALQAAISKYPELELVVDHVVDTDWDAGTRQRVMAGLLAKYGRIDAVVSDYGTIDYGTLNAYKQAGMKLPALAAFASSNGTNCYWEKSKFPFMSVDGQTNVIRESLLVGLKAYGGEPQSGPVTVELPTMVDTTAGKDPKCDPNLPEDAADGSDLSPEQLHAIFE